MIKVSIDDGCQSDVRIAELCQRHEIQATFYWPVEWHSLAYENGYQPLNYLDAVSISQNHEVGSHTVTHRHLTKLDQFEIAQEVYGSKFMLQRMFRRDITKFAPPRGYTNEEITRLTLQYYATQRLTVGHDLVHIHPNSGANGNRPWRELLNEKLDAGITVELWGHSWEFDKFDLWDQIEEAFNEVARR